MSDDQMVLKRAVVRILDPDRRLDIYKGWVKAPESFFEKYGKRFISEPKVGKEKDAPIRVITEWADKSRAVEFAEIRKANRLAAKREMEEFMAADKIAAKAEQKEESATSDEAEETEPVEVAEDVPAVAKGTNPLPPEKAVWKGAKKLKKKV
jgi:hypothetical protein